MGGAGGGDNDWVAVAVPPQVVTLPRESVRAVPGQTVTFTCVATGVPTPIVTWRLNWGHTPSSHRWAGPGAGPKRCWLRIGGRDVDWPWEELAMGVVCDGSSFSLGWGRIGGVRLGAAVVGGTRLGGACVQGVVCVGGILADRRG